jgi:HK97 family phage portal protein
MGRFSQFFKNKNTILNKKYLSGGMETLWLGLGAAKWSSRNYLSLASEGYQKNVIAFRSIRLLSSAAASVKLKLYRGDEQIMHHPVLDILERPNPLDTKVSFFESCYSYLNISGNCYMEMVRGADDLPSEIYLLRPDRMTVIAGTGAVPSSYSYRIGGMEQKFEVDVLTGQSNILHLKTFNPSNDYYGMSPLEAAAYGVDVHNAASNWNKSLFDNAARPSGALIYEPKEGSSTLSNDQFTRLKHEMEENFQGSRNAGRPLLLEGGLKWQQIAFSPADMDFINAKHVSAREIALAFGVPPMLLSIPGDNTYSNYREANRALWRTAVLPCVEKIITALNIWLLPLFEAGLRLEIDLDSIVELSSDREAYWQRIGAADFMTINEKRAAVGLKSVAGGDELK